MGATSCEDGVRFVLGDCGVIVGDANLDDNGVTSKATLMKQEISLTLSSKFDVIDEGKSDLKALLVK